jgi:hypothetical protein
MDPEPGRLAIAPMRIEELAKDIRLTLSSGYSDRKPKKRVWGGTLIRDLHAEQSRSFGLPFDVDFDKLDETGWGIVFHEDTGADIRAALAPLVSLRSHQSQSLFKEFDYRSGEETRDWFERHQIVAGNVDPEIVPYYLLLVGGPESIPFEFQCLLGVEYAVGRLAFDTAAEYERYARSIVDYEQVSLISNAKEIVYWGTHHLGGGATELSSSQLISPLANGIQSASGALKQPIAAQVHYRQKLFVGEAATKAALLQTFCADKPPAVLFTASHGIAISSGRPNRLANQGALLCQDWPSFGSVRPEHILAAVDVANDANVSGMVAVLFASFGAATSDVDQYLSQANNAPPLAPHPFVAALPRRLLSHPNGSALAVISYVDRAWGFSIQVPNAAPQRIAPFRNGLGQILTGSPVGRALTEQFGVRYAALSSLLASALSPSAPSMQLSDRDVATYWLQRNDAQNYVLLGDPAVRIRNDQLR